MKIPVIFFFLDSMEEYAGYEESNNQDFHRYLDLAVRWGE